MNAAPVLDTSLLAHWDYPGRQKARASSVLRPQGGNSYGPENAIDRDPATAWCEGAPGTGEGHWIELTLGPLRNQLCEPRGWAVVPGYAKSAATWKDNARISAPPASG